jgi:hypothetical protein
MNRSIRPWTEAAAVLAFWPLEKPEMFEVARISIIPSGWVVTWTRSRSALTTRLSSCSLVASELRSVRRTTRTRFSFEVKVCFSRSSWFCRSSGVIPTWLGRIDRIWTNSRALAS